MSKERELLKLALEALKKGDYALVNAICEELKQTQPEQEPVAWYDSKSGWVDFHSFKPVRKPSAPDAEWLPLYTTPQNSETFPQRTWVGLTPQERDEINDQVYGAVPHHVAFHAAIEAKLKEKNT